MITDDAIARAVQTTLHGLDFTDVMSARVRRVLPLIMRKNGATLSELTKQTGLANSQLVSTFAALRKRKVAVGTVPSGKLRGSSSYIYHPPLIQKSSAATSAAAHAAPAQKHYPAANLADDMRAAIAEVERVYLLMCEPYRLAFGTSPALTISISSDGKHSTVHEFK